MMIRTVALAALAAAATSAFGQVWNEAGEAGDMPGTAQAVSGVGALTDIFGSTTTQFDADMYLIRISNPGAFSATTNITPGTMTDTTLYLFNLNGTGIAKNDDIDGNNWLSILPAGDANYATLASGDYLLAVAPFAFAPFWNNPPSNISDLIFNINQFTGVTPPQNPGPIQGWANAGASDFGTYHITLEGAEFVTVPAPSAAALLGIAGVVVGSRRRRA